MKMIFSLIFAFLCSLNVFVYSEEVKNIQLTVKNNQCIINLPYCSEKHRNQYFAENVLSALIVDQIIVKNERVTPECDSALYLQLSDEYKTHYVFKHNESLFIKMIWETNNENNWTFSYRGNRFIVPSLEEITIHYRIIFPFPFGNAEKLLQRRFSEKYISKEYSATFVLPDLDGRK